MKIVFICFLIQIVIVCKGGTNTNCLLKYKDKLSVEFSVYVKKGDNPSYWKGFYQCNLKKRKPLNVFDNF